MAGNSTGEILRLSTFGESHGPAIGGVLDGFPPGVQIDLEKVQQQLLRRRPGQSALSSPRKEADQLEILSGLFEGKTTGTPIGFIIRNADQRSGDYAALKDVFRPSHADYTYQEKYGVRDFRGGGRASARETACRVAAGAMAGQFLEALGIRIVAFVDQVGEVFLNSFDLPPEPALIDASVVRCPDPATARLMEELIAKVRDQGDTVGGAIQCRISGCPPGLGEPVFDKLHADLGKAMLSINAVKGFEIGSGFAAASMRGSQHNDAFFSEAGSIRTRTNFSGGIQGGISNGQEIYFRVAFKPVASLKLPQTSVDSAGNEVELTVEGRHDPCVVPRAVPIVESMAALVIADHLLRLQTINAASKS